MFTHTKSEYANAPSPLFAPPSLVSPPCLPLSHPHTCINVETRAGEKERKRDMRAAQQHPFYVSCIFLQAVEQMKFTAQAVTFYS